MKILVHATENEKIMTYRVMKLGERNQNKDYCGHENMIGRYFGHENYCEFHSEIN